MPFTAAQHRARVSAIPDQPVGLTLPSRKRRTPPQPRTIETMTDNKAVIGKKPAKKPYRVNKLETILRESAKLFCERGYDATSLDDVADSVKIHKATVYHYIKSKEEILYMCLEHSLSGYEDTLIEMKDTTIPPVTRLVKFFGIIIEAQNNDFGRCLCLVGRRPLSEETGEQIRQFQRKLDFTVRGLLEEGMADGSIRNCDVRLATAMLFGAFNWIPRWRSPGHSVGTEELAKIFLDIFLNGVATSHVSI